MQKKILTVPYAESFLISAAEVSSFRSSHWFSAHWRQPGFSLRLSRGQVGCGSCDRKRGIWKQRNSSLVHLLHIWMGGKGKLWYVDAVIKVLICFLWHDTECHLALRIPFQPKGLKHHIPAVHLAFYTNRRNSRCYHGVPSERWQWTFYRDQWDGYIIPRCDLFLYPTA